MKQVTKKKLRGRLKKGREIRRLQAAALYDVRAGHVTLRSALEDPPDALLRVPIHRVLECAPHMGDAGTKRVLVGCGVYPLDTLGALSGAARDEILRNLPPRAVRTVRRAKYDGR